MASVYFLKIDGIEGQSADKGHEKWVELISFSHGSQQNISIQRGGTDVMGRGQFLPFTFVHAVDKATPKLQHYCMSGNKIDKVEFAYCRFVGGAQTPVYELVLENVKVGKAVVTTITSDDDSLAQQPVETVELIAGKISWKVTPIKPDATKDGAIEANFNQISNE
ncbi:MAG: type VI secretion system tube protein Hcp [Deferribacteraceae bacterium]|jgi:type VI secretion system secreted protein Hcp|nr:type VI secretion system tube protein Hcp [Deferribacteraceae bacterium]